MVEIEELTPRVKGELRAFLQDDPAIAECTRLHASYQKGVRRLTVLEEPSRDVTTRDNRISLASRSNALNTLSLESHAGHGSWN